MKVKVSVVNAFIDGVRGGNPAAVVLDADELTGNQKQAIAQAVGLSETAFVSASSVADFKLDFYTPTRQIAHCGHATVAVFSFLAQTGRIGEGWLAKETIDGTRKILIDNGKAFMEQLAPTYRDIATEQAAILESIGVREEHLIAAPMLVNTGNSFVILGVESAPLLAQIEPDQAAIKRLSEGLDLIGYYLFTAQTRRPGRDASTRMLAPRYGIAEEAATGMAAGPLACYLFDKMAIKKDHFDIEQGYLMQPSSPSVIEVNLECKGGDIAALMAGGVARLSRDGVIEI